MQQGEFQGFINVKITSRIKSRSFLPRKTWKRQWVVVRRSRISRNGVELVIGRTSPNIFQVAADDVICRTESRTQNYAFGIFSHRSKQSANIYLSGISETDSQKWIATIRKLLKPPFMPVEENEFSVAIIDNAFSRTAGLSGLYGTMRIASDCVTVIDPYTSKSKVEWSWDDLSSFHVSSAMVEEDKGHICTVITTRKFSAGIGQIHLFCHDGVRLTRILRMKSVGANSRCPPMAYRHHTFSCTSATEKSSRRLPSIPALSTPQNRVGGKFSFLQSRRMSRSEGNLLSIISKLDKSGSMVLDNRTNCADPSFFSSESKNDYFSRVSPGIDSNGFGLILSTPVESEGDSESLHEYQKLERDDELTSLCFSMSPNEFLPPRRESRVSLASGVYEEIVSSISINVDFSSHDGVTEARRDSSPPPPLPPRREWSTNNICEEDASDDCATNRLQSPQALNRFLSKSAEDTAFKWPSLLPPRTPTFSANEFSRKKSSSWSFPKESDYLPMSPSCGYFQINTKGNFSTECAEDQLYTVMKSIKGT